MRSPPALSASQPCAAPRWRRGSYRDARVSPADRTCMAPPPRRSGMGWCRCRRIMRAGAACSRARTVPSLRSFDILMRLVHTRFSRAWACCTYNLFVRGDGLPTVASHTRVDAARAELAGVAACHKRTVLHPDKF